MARKKNSAAKQMHAAQNPWDQYLISISGPRFEELRAELDLLGELNVCEQYGKLDEWAKEYAVAFFTRMLSEARQGKAVMLRRLSEAAEMRGRAEPWRGWIIANYKVPVASDTEDGPSLWPIRDPDPIPAIQQELANRFNVHLDDRKLRAELRALGVPFAPTKRGRRPAKPARGKRSS